MSTIFKILIVIGVITIIALGARSLFALDQEIWVMMNHNPDTGEWCVLKMPQNEAFLTPNLDEAIEHARKHLLKITPAEG